MIFGILALALKNKTLGILAIISGICFSIWWFYIAFSYPYYPGDTYYFGGALLIIAVTCIPDLTMGIITVVKINKQVKIQSSNETTSKKDSSSLTSKLTEIKSLKETGVLTEEEYLEAKKNILKN